MKTPGFGRFAWMRGSTPIPFDIQRMIAKDKRLKKMQLIYDGIITSDTARYVKNAIDEGYRFVVEVSKYPPHAWFEANFKKQDWYQHDCDDWGGGHTEKRNSTLYRILHHDFSKRDENHNVIGGGFLLMNNENDYNTVLKGLPELVVNPKPFKTGF